MFESLLKSMPSILDDLKVKSKSEYSVDVTTDEGIKKVRDSAHEIKENIKSLKENLEHSWLSIIFDKDTLNVIESSLDKVLEDAEKKYKEAHKDVTKEKKSNSATNYIRPILSLASEDASEAYSVVDKYLKTQICPRLPKDTDTKFIQSIKESLVDFAAWLALNKY